MFPVAKELVAQNRVRVTASAFLEPFADQRQVPSLVA